ncbi:hypothetical protein [Maridesulfovibrio bastinii]|uniref:hypothetical protein n=1 Tax=Maridesulfovibrio bastinii TaxID=47157 RepID=UPI000413154F|nr:hypothetical protein [Maridesulfovibrio bastinii]
MKSNGNADFVSENIAIMGSWVTKYALFYFWSEGGLKSAFEQGIKHHTGASIGKPLSAGEN